MRHHPGEENAAEPEQDPADLAFVPQEHFARECRALIGLVQADLRRLEAARSRRAPAALQLPRPTAPVHSLVLRILPLRDRPCAGLPLRRCQKLFCCTHTIMRAPCTYRAAPAAGERDAGQAERTQAEAAQAEAELLERRLTGEQLERVLEIAEGIDVGYSLLSGRDSLWGEPDDQGLDEPESLQTDEGWPL